MKSSWRLVLLLVLMAVPRSAFAQPGADQPLVNQRFFNPFLNTTLTSPSGTGAGSMTGFGVALGRLGGIGGMETEIVFHPNFVGDASDVLKNNRMFMFSENFLFGPVKGPVKPYGAVGFGDMFLNLSTKIDLEDQGSLSKNYLAINVGAGFFYAFQKHGAARVDVRHVSAIGFDVSNEEEGSGVDFKLKTKFGFWRSTVGVALTFYSAPRR